MIKSTYFLIAFLLFFSCQNNSGEYVCTPCDLPCDKLSFSEAGICPHCNMKLIKKSEIIDIGELTVNEIYIEGGSGIFLIDGGDGNENKTIAIYYHRPENFRPDSKILIVLPGAGRNADSYRDAWVEESERYSVLILSPEYSEEEYGFGDYHICGIMKNINLEKCVEYVEGTNIAKLDEDEFNFDLNLNKAEWMFKDFDRLFDMVANSINSIQKNYDIFGHSAGGQILHRMAIFNPVSKADRIIAANSGFYTLPSTDFKMPFGIKNIGITEEDLKRSFANKLIIFCGELDNENETGGTLLRSETADKQGLHRLERGNYFFKFSNLKAEELGAEFNWEISVAPNVGHDHRAMGDAAAILLYEENN